MYKLYKIVYLASIFLSCFYEIYFTDGTTCIHLGVGGKKTDRFLDVRIIIFCV